jgi:hypothetical protein
LKDRLAQLVYFQQVPVSEAFCERAILIGDLIEDPIAQQIETD